MDKVCLCDSACAHGGEVRRQPVIQVHARALRELGGREAPQGLVPRRHVAPEAPLVVLISGVIASHPRPLWVLTDNIRIVKKLRAAQRELGITRIKMRIVLSKTLRKGVRGKGRGS